MIDFKQGATFNDDMIIKYIDRVLMPYKSQRALEKLFLLIDCANCHLTDKVKKHCEKSKIELLFVPRRLTNLLQPADVMWFFLIKTTFHYDWNEWFLTGEKVFFMKFSLILFKDLIINLLFKDFH